MYVRNYITENVLQDIKPLLSTKEEETRASTYLMRYSMLFPSRYYVVNYENFESFMEKYINIAAGLVSYACEKGGKS